MDDQADLKLRWCGVTFDFDATLQICISCNLFSYRVHNCIVNFAFMRHNMSCAISAFSKHRHQIAFMIHGYKN